MKQLMKMKQNTSVLARFSSMLDSGQLVNKQRNHLINRDSTLQDVMDIIIDDRLIVASNVAVYGIPGSGRTTLMSAIPGHLRVIDSDIITLLIHILEMVPNDWSLSLGQFELSHPEIWQDTALAQSSLSQRTIDIVDALLERVHLYGVGHTHALRHSLPVRILPLAHLYDEFLRAYNKQLVQEGRVPHPILGVGDFFTSRHKGLHLHPLTDFVNMFDDDSLSRFADLVLTYLSRKDIV
jgi:hypothetical protein